MAFSPEGAVQFLLVFEVQGYMHVRYLQRHHVVSFKPEEEK
jgi:hypothetical protein